MGPFWTENPGSIFSVSPDFWLYWAVTIPTTTIVIVIWQTWLWIYRRRQIRRLKDIEESADDEGDSFSEERSVRAGSYSASAARSEHSQRRFLVINGSSASQHSVSEMSGRSAPVASLRLHQSSQTRFSNVSQANQHSKQSQ